MYHAGPKTTSYTMHGDTCMHVTDWYRRGHLQPMTAAFTQSALAVPVRHRSGSKKGSYATQWCHKRHAIGREDSKRLYAEFLIAKPSHFHHTTCLESRNAFTRCLEELSFYSILAHCE